MIERSESGGQTLRSAPSRRSFRCGMVVSKEHAQ